MNAGYNVLKIFMEIEKKAVFNFFGILSPTKYMPPKFDK